MSAEPEKLAEGTLISHLLELRDRLLRSMVAIGIAFVPCVLNSNEIFSYVASPLLAKLPPGSNLIATGVMSPFTTPYVGIAFAYYFVFPMMFQFFAATTPKGVAMMTDINNYLDFVLTMFFCFGLAFEVPVAVVLLVVMGVVRIEKLKQNRGYVLIGIFILAALITPPDAISQCSLAIPMYLLYEGGILMAQLLSRMRSRDASQAKAEDRPP